MTEEETEIPQDIPKEKKRARKKQLYSNLKNLMEFYFSSANLTKDRWLSNKLNENGSLELTHFLNFNKVRALTNDVNDLVKALRSSEILEVSDDCKVKRTKPIEPKENLDECVIYVEQLPADADHDWLKNFFSCYGPIDYISIPKYANSKKCKGFAFIEFSDSASAQKAIEEYKKAGYYLSNSIEPQELLSIVTFEKEQSSNLHSKLDPELQVPKGSEIPDSKKRKNVEMEFEDNSKILNSEKNKKIKLDCVENNDNLETSIVLEDVNSEECCGELEGNADEFKRKKNRKKKKKTKKNKITPETTGFKILSKKDWKCLRNKYLNIQREKMAQLKKHLKQKRTYNNFHNKNKNTNTKGKNGNDMEIKSPQSKDFIAGVVVKINFSEPMVNLKEFKNDLKCKHENIKYIDVKEGSFNAFVRLATPEAANDLCEKSIWDNTEILKGDDELNYWAKLERERQISLSKPAQKVKKSGKEKMLIKAEKILGKHISFNDEISG